MIRDAPPPLLATPTHAGRERIAAACGLASSGLLAAALRYAHHWGPRTDAIVAAWAVATLGGLAASLRSLDRPPGGGRLAWLGLALSGVSVLALALAGVAYLLGADPTGACGGG